MDTNKTKKQNKMKKRETKKDRKKDKKTIREEKFKYNRNRIIFTSYSYFSETFVNR